MLVVVVALSGCGESAEAKAKKQVCSARNDMAKQLDTLRSLTLSTTAAATAKSSLEAIRKDVGEIKSAQGQLGSARKQQVEASTHTFITKLDTIASELSSGLSASNARAQVTTALSQLATDYAQTLGAINCE